MSAGIRFVALTIVAMLAAQPGGASGTEDLAAAAGPVILSVTGSIAVTNAEGRADFDRATLDALPQHEITSFTDWTDGPQRFRGPLLADLMDRLGARGDRIVATALNDYSFPIPMTDLDRHDVLLATRHNGEAMPVREKGPIWIIYPQDEPTSRLGENNDKMVWQLRRLHVE